MGAVSEPEIDVSPAATRPHDVEGVQGVRGGWHLVGHDLGSDDHEGAGIDARIAATGFTRTFRRPPVHVGPPVLDLATRGGHGCSEVPAAL